MGELFAAAARYAVPSTALGALAAGGYLVAYAALYVGAGRVLHDFGEASLREWVTLGLTWLRLGATLAAILTVKLLIDLARAALVELGGWSVGRALAVAARELARRGLAYAGLYLAIGLATPLVTVAWAYLAGPLTPASWVGLAVVFALQQLFVALRIGLRLAHLAATQGLLLAGRE